MITARSLGLLAAALVLVFVAAGKPQSGEGAYSFGYDISFPQCGTTYPAGGDFGIVGVTGGLAWSQNPCLASQWQWAKSQPGTPAFYTNTGNPGPQSSYWDRPGPMVCAQPNSYADTGCAYNYGWNAAENAFQVASDVTSPSDALNHTWWVDVEVANSWDGTAAANRASIQGFIDYFEHAGVPKVGVYSTWYQWGVITDNWSLPGMPNWVAGANSAADAADYCSISATGGPVEMSQYPSGSLSANLVCGSDTPVTATPTATAAQSATPSPSATSTSTVTATPPATATATPGETVTTEPTPTPTTQPGSGAGATDGFESGNWSGGSGWLGVWSTSGSPAVQSSGSPQSGQYHARLVRRDFIVRGVDTGGLTSPMLSFAIKAASWESRDGAEVQVSSDGQSWVSLLSLRNGHDDNTYRSYSFDVSSIAGGVLWVRFVSAGNSGADYLYVDNVEVSEAGGADATPTASPPRLTATPSPPMQTPTLSPTLTATPGLTSTPAPSATPLPSATPSPTLTSTPGFTPSPAATAPPWWCAYLPNWC